MACRSRLPRARSYLIVVRGSAWEAASCTSRNGTPASSAAVMNACLSVWGADGLGDPGAARDLADDPPGAVPVQAAPVSGEEDRAAAAFAGNKADRPGGTRSERDGDDRAALGGNRQG